MMKNSFSGPTVFLVKLDHGLYEQELDKRLCEFIGEYPYDPVSKYYCLILG